MYPFDEGALRDDFQDAIVLEQEDYYIEMEVIHYPYGTAEDSISANPNWQEDYTDMNEYLDPGITTNWDATMRVDLLSELQADGIVVGNLTDKQVVEQVSYWLLNKYTALDVFTTYYIYYPNGQPEVYPGLADAYEEEFYSHGYEVYWPIEEHFEHELLGKGMYYNKTRGTCTSTAVALTTVLRAIGIPTRMIIVIPIVDASNPSQSQLVEQRISNNHVRQVVLDWLSGAGAGFTAHTFNEVYVGNEWHRLNYSKLGQPILDEYCFGLHTHLYTFGDLSDANLAPTWGWRYGKSITSDVFGYYNPYTTMTLSDPNTKPIGPTIYVDDDAPGDPGPGNPVISDPCEEGSSLHPFDSIQEAIDASDYGDIVIVQEGTYTGLGNRDIDFRGLAITVRSTDPNNPKVVAATVMDCQGSELEPHRGFYFHNSEDTDSILDGLTITNGYVSGNWPDDSGGGIICHYASPIIKNCIVTNNTAEHHGGGIYNYNSNPTLINCMFNANSAGWNGGGMHNGPSNPNLINCIFAKNTSGSYGGGISTSSDSSPILTNCTFSGNSGSQGGAVGVRDSNALLTNCVLWGDIPNEIYVAAGDMPNITYSNVEGGYTGTGNIDSDPCFVSPDNNDYHLVCSSPCFNAGDPGFTPDPNKVDIDGEPRTRYGRVDMGADELFQIAPDFEPDGDVDFADLVVFTGQWLLEELSWDVYPQGGDGFVDFFDWAVFANSWQNTTDINDLIDFTEQWLLFGADSYCADIFPESTGDGIVNFLDFVFFANYWLLGE
ncbi:MAG: hypothetical protein JSV99_05270 [Planctomycetota bacterium]|nr:MAG: hypothetical protein JSV99_05270 [Planctomycetota bacterium]